ncbi:porimin [Danio rerio]|uniref:Porimin n=1 Tax=Danio rerio TaxID=7955 RepID=A0A8M9PW00_DANRE|nr:porimin isoform X1 [Danio rerio]XP_021328999.1 porimin isoform X1 [Danio rerio]|eukprot:XP_001923119.1 porimin isoform X1 [Danio rerio]
MNLCLWLNLITFSGLLLSLDTRAHQAEEEPLTASNMSHYSTHLSKAKSITPTEASVNTLHISTPSKHLISASIGVPPGHLTAGGGFDAGSFLGGMILAFIIILAVAVGYRLFCSKRAIRYRVIEEHDAII